MTIINILPQGVASLALGYVVLGFQPAPPKSEIEYILSTLCNSNQYS